VFETAVQFGGGLIVACANSHSAKWQTEVPREANGGKEDFTTQLHGEHNSRYRKHDWDFHRTEEVKQGTNGSIHNRLSFVSGTLHSRRIFRPAVQDQK
jgi:hypothetical protein